MESVKHYKGHGYGDINKFLREHTQTEIDKFLSSDYPLAKHIKNIDRQMKYNIFDKPLFRGIPGAFIPEAIKQTSGIIVNKGFTSSSMSKDVMKSFTDSHGCCIIVFAPPKDVKSVIMEYTGNYSEAEILFERNTQFVIDKEKSKHPLYVATLKKWNPPNISESEQKNAEILAQAVLQTGISKLKKLYKDVGEERFLELRKQHYKDEGDDSDIAEDMAEADLMDIK